MNTIIQDRIAELIDVCDRRRVRRLAVFGSAASDRFNPASSDLDFLVEFKPMPWAEYADTYFALLEDLCSLFGRPIDVVEAIAVRNPYFAQSVEESQVVLYDATSGAQRTTPHLRA